jgi:hypothetical protein
VDFQTLLLGVVNQHYSISLIGRMQSHY